MKNDLTPFLGGASEDSAESLCHMADLKNLKRPRTRSPDRVVVIAAFVCFVIAALIVAGVIK